MIKSRLVGSSASLKVGKQVVEYNGKDLPLEYDPDALKDYYGKRPGVVLQRFVQVQSFPFLAARGQTFACHSVRVRSCIPCLSIVTVHVAQ